MLLRIRVLSKRYLHVDGPVDALADVFTAVQSGAGAEGDVILLGDLNADEQHLGRLGRGLSQVRLLLRAARPGRPGGS